MLVAGAGIRPHQLWCGLGLYAGARRPHGAVGLPAGAAHGQRLRDSPAVVCSTPAADLYQFGPWPVPAVICGVGWGLPHHTAHGAHRAAAGAARGRDEYAGCLEPGVGRLAADRRPDRYLALAAA